MFEKLDINKVISDLNSVTGLPWRISAKEKGALIAVDCVNYLVFAITEDDLFDMFSISVRYAIEDDISYGPQVCRKERAYRSYIVTENLRGDVITEYSNLRFIANFVALNTDSLVPRNDVSENVARLLNGRKINYMFWKRLTSIAPVVGMTTLEPYYCFPDYSCVLNQLTGVPLTITNTYRAKRNIEIRIEAFSHKPMVVGLFKIDLMVRNARDDWKKEALRRCIESQFVPDTFSIVTDKDGKSEINIRFSAFTDILDSDLLSMFSSPLIQLFITKATEELTGIGENK